MNKGLMWGVPAGIILVGGIGLAIGYSMGKNAAPRQQYVHAVG